MMSLLLLLAGGHVTPLPNPDWAANYDLLAAFDTYAPGVILQRPILDALSTAWIAGGFKPLTAAQIAAIAGPLPPLVTSIRKLPEGS